MRDLRKAGEDGYIYRLEYSKTQQAGVTADSTPDKPILGRSAQALSAWLEVAGIREGAIFRRIWTNRVGPALLPGSVAAIVKRRANMAGLEGDFGAHSLRSGFVTEAGKQGVPLPAVMAMPEGAWCQLFFHFVDAHGDLLCQTCDGRSSLGPVARSSILEPARPEPANMDEYQGGETMQMRAWPAPLMAEEWTGPRGAA